MKRRPMATPIRPAYEVTDMSGCWAVAQEIACWVLFVVGVVALLWVVG